MSYHFIHLLHLSNEMYQIKCGEMNSSNENIHDASGITQDEKICIWALGREACLRSKLNFLPQANHNWKPIIAFPMHLGRQMGAAYSICT